jgi:hypothetical protein
MDQKMHDCINNCNECHNICLETLNYCLEKGGDHANAEHIRTLTDCAQICHTSEDFMLRGSDSHPKTCGVCAEVCRKCAESCDQFPDDEQMQQCAEVCRKCADSCQEMAAS